MSLKYYVVNRFEFDPPKLEENGDLVWGKRNFFNFWYSTNTDIYAGWSDEFNPDCLVDKDFAERMAAEYPGSFVSSFTLTDDMFPAKITCNTPSPDPE